MLVSVGANDLGGRPHIVIHGPYSEHIQSILSKSPRFIKTDSIQLAPHVYPANCLSGGRLEE